MKIIVPGGEPAEGILLEMVFDPDEQKTRFAIWNGNEVRYQSTFPLAGGRVLVPYSPENNLIKNEVLLFSSRADEYHSQAELVTEIRAFIHRYVQITPLFETVAAYYVLLSWIYDAFNELPYLRVRGDYGSGKTRFLLIIGSLCYRPIFAGTSTVSPLFRILDSFRGTLIIDEGDFRFSDERAEIVKILNNGNARGFPVLRSELADNRREYNPTAYAVFGPKLIATRGSFEDRALESRFLTEAVGQFQLRQNIPINLPAGWKEESLQLRNKLLLFRFRNCRKHRLAGDQLDNRIEPRLRQIFGPLLNVIDDPAARASVADLARDYQDELVADRGLDTEAQILEVIRDLTSSGGNDRLTIKEITTWFADRHGADHKMNITPKWIGLVIRKRLQLKTQKSNGVFVIPSVELGKLDRLYEKFGITTGAPGQNAD